MSEMLQYKCPNCGGGLEFDTFEQMVKCPFCDSEFEPQSLKNYDEVLSGDKEENMSWDTNPGSEWSEEERDGIRVYICKSCGGEIVGDENTAATDCPFCGNSVILTGNLTGELRPDLVIPFKYDKNAAKQAYFKNLKSKAFLPKVFKDENHIDEIKGIYVPFWLFDAEAEASFRYRAKKVRFWSDFNYDYTETSTYSVIREGVLGFNNVPADGSAKMPDELMESLEPYDLSEVVDFQTAYLSGYFADKYDIDDKSCVGRVNERIKQSTSDKFLETVIGYSSVSPEYSCITLSDCKSRYALYPVWLLNTTWRDKKYTFAMNGQTGKLVGNLPCDYGAFWSWWGIIAACVSVVSFCVATLIKFI